MTNLYQTVPVGLRGNVLTRNRLGSVLEWNMLLDHIDVLNGKCETLDNDPHERRELGEDVGGEIGFGAA